MQNSIALSKTSPRIQLPWLKPLLGVLLIIAIIALLAPQAVVLNVENGPLSDGTATTEGEDWSAEVTLVTQETTPGRCTKSVRGWVRYWSSSKDLFQFDMKAGPCLGQSLFTELVNQLKGVNVPNKIAKWLATELVNQLVNQ